MISIQIDEDALKRKAVIEGMFPPLSTAQDTKDLTLFHPSTGAIKRS